jgi:tRNA(fMet)-specific endonuclease VapC
MSRAPGLGYLQAPHPARLLALIADLLQEVTTLDFDATCSEKFGRVKGELGQRGLSVPDVDLLIASVALVHDLTLVTHNTADFRNIPNLRLEDRLTP